MKAGNLCPTPRNKYTGKSCFVQKESGGEKEQDHGSPAHALPADPRLQGGGVGPPRRRRPRPSWSHGDRREDFLLGRRLHRDGGGDREGGGLGTSEAADLALEPLDAGPQAGQFAGAGEGPQGQHDDQADHGQDKHDAKQGENHVEHGGVPPAPGRSRPAVRRMIGHPHYPPSWAPCKRKPSRAGKQRGDSRTRKV